MLQKYTIIKDLKGAKHPENCRTYITIFNLINGHKKIGITKIHFNKTNYYSNYYNTQIGLHICFAFVFKARYLIVQSYIFANEANSTKKIHSQCFPNYIRINNFGKRKTGWFSYHPQKIEVSLSGQIRRAAIPTLSTQKPQTSMS
jgi:hypothetical protein